MTAPYTIVARRFTAFAKPRNGVIGIASLIIEPIGIAVTSVFLVQESDGLRIFFPKYQRNSNGETIEEKPLWFPDPARWDKFSDLAVAAIRKKFLGHLDKARRPHPVDALQAESV